MSFEELVENVEDSGCGFPSLVSGVKVDTSRRNARVSQQFAHGLPERGEYAPIDT